MFFFIKRIFLICFLKKLGTRNILYHKTLIRKHGCKTFRQTFTNTQLVLSPLATISEMQFIHDPAQYMLSYAPCGLWHYGMPFAAAKVTEDPCDQERSSTTATTSRFSWDSAALDSCDESPEILELDRADLNRQEVAAILHEFSQSAVTSSSNSSTAEPAKEPKKTFQTPHRKAGRRCARIYEVDIVKAHRGRGCQLQFFVTYKGYKGSSWQPVQNFLFEDGSINTKILGYAAKRSLRLPF